MGLFEPTSFFLNYGTPRSLTTISSLFTSVTLGRLTSLGVFPILYNRNSNSYFVGSSYGSIKIMCLKCLVHSRCLMKGGYFWSSRFRLTRHLSPKKLFLITPSGVDHPISVPLSISSLPLNHALLYCLLTPISPARL